MSKQKKLVTSGELRNLAEAKLATVVPIETGSHTPDQYLHELQVHQIELEMQNDELQRTQVALEESRDRFMTLYEFAPVGYLTLSREGMISEINLTGALMLGVDRKHFLKRSFARLVESKDRDRWDRHFMHAHQHEGKQSCELAFKREDGATFHARLDYEAFNSGISAEMRIVLADITKQKQAETGLHALTMELQKVHEEERTTIAREIHDQLGSNLNAQKITVHQIKTELSTCHLKCINASKLKEYIESISQLTVNASETTRNLISSLRPTILDDFGLLAAIEWQARQFYKLTGIECEVNCIGDKGNLDDLRSTALFRIVQESLTNVSKHSGASKVEIEYHHSEEEVLLIVGDNGCGIMERRAEQSGGFGILGMKERVKQLGGTIRFDSPTGKGLCLMVNFPATPTL